MVDLMRVAGDPSPPGSDPRGFRRGRQSVGVGVPLALAVTGATVAVALSVGSSAHLSRPHAPSGRDVLLAAATAVDRGAGTTTGRYWRVLESGRYTLDAGYGGGQGPIQVRVRDGIWLAGPKGGRSVADRQCLGIRRPTSAERAARADRPSRAWPADSAAARTCIAGSGPAKRNAGLTAATDYRLADVDVSPIWLDHLSSEPAVLRRQIEAKLAAAHQGGLGVFGHVVLPQLTADLPLRPEIRAAVLRMMAGLPGVRAVGRAVDALGRTGQAVVITGLGMTTTELRWIIDPGTGGVLAVQEVVTGRAHDAVVVAEKTYLSAGWTDVAPHPGVAAAIAARGGG